MGHLGHFWAIFSHFWPILGHFWPILGHLGPFRVTFWPSWVILGLDVALGHSRRVFFFFFVANIAFTRFFCRECRDYVLFGVEFWQKFWQKFLEILRILAEILRKKLACGASGIKGLPLPRNRTSWDKYMLNGISKHKICLSLFGCEELKLHKQHIVHCISY